MGLHLYDQTTFNFPLESVTKRRPPESCIIVLAINEFQRQLELTSDSSQSAHGAYSTRCGYGCLIGCHSVYSEKGVPGRSLVLAGSTSRPRRRILVYCARASFKKRYSKLRSPSVSFLALRIFQRHRIPQNRAPTSAKPRGERKHCRYNDSYNAAAELGSGQ